MKNSIKSYNEIQGWCDYDDLYSQFSEILNDSCTFVEVGVWKGRSVCFLGQQLKIRNKNPQIFAVDTYKGSLNESVHQEEVLELGGSTLPLFKSYLEDLGLSNMITPIEKTSELASEDFADNSIDVIFIDGDHDYEAVLNDLNKWFPKMKKNSIMSGHDFGGESVRKAVLEFFANKTNQVYHVSSCCWLVKIIKQ